MKATVKVGQMIMDTIGAGNAIAITNGHSKAMKAMKAKAMKPMKGEGRRR
jgi:hypothetical protein